MKRGIIKFNKNNSLLEVECVMVNTMLKNKR